MATRKSSSTKNRATAANRTHVPFNVSDWGGERLTDNKRWRYGAWGAHEAVVFTERGAP